MEQGSLIDSNILIGYLDNKIPESGMVFMHSIIDAGPKISVITKIEVLRFNAPAHAYKILEDFVNAAIVFDLENSVVEKTIKLCRLTKIKLPDAVIAATAIVHNLNLLTRNVSDFNGITGLNITNPYTL